MFGGVVGFLGFGISVHSVVGSSSELLAQPRNPKHNATPRHGTNSLCPILDAPEPRSLLCMWSVFLI